MTKEDQEFIECQFGNLSEKMNGRFDALHREIDGRFKAMWRDMNAKFRDQNSILRSQDNKLDAILDLVAEQENKIAERELA